MSEMAKRNGTFVGGPPRHQLAEIVEYNKQMEKEKLLIKRRTECPKEIIITVNSGMCNRMFLIISALRISKQYGHVLTVFWPERTGRYGLPYYGEINSDWDDYFIRMEGVSTYGIYGSIKLQNNVIALNHEASLPENLPIINGNRWCDKDKTLALFSPKVIDPLQKKIIVQKDTKPFGVESDNMEKYMNYFDKIGVYNKENNPYLLELSIEAKKFKLIPKMQLIVDQFSTIFSRFSSIWGIHIRGTDLEPFTNINRNDAIKTILEASMYNNNIGIFIASDEPMSKYTWITEMLGNKLITYNNNIKLENSVEGTQHGLVDLFLLSKCNRIYGTSGSSFSMMSWMLSELSEYTIHS